MLPAILLVVESISVFNLDVEVCMGKAGSHAWKSQNALERAEQKGILLRFPRFNAQQSHYSNICTVDVLSIE